MRDDGGRGFVNWFGGFVLMRCCISRRIFVWIGLRGPSAHAWRLILACLSSGKGGLSALFAHFQLP